LPASLKMDRERTSRTRAAERALDATAAAGRLTHRLSAIHSVADVGLLTGELRRIMAASFPGLPATALARSEDTIRWHALGARCREARGSRSIRDVSVALAIPQYRLTRSNGGDCRNPRGPRLEVLQVPRHGHVGDTLVSGEPRARGSSRTCRPRTAGASAPRGRPQASQGDTRGTGQR
jgi:hypothetical protein